MTGTPWLNDNGTFLLVGSRDRANYLQFDFSGLDALPLAAVLRLTEAEGVTTGSMNLSLYAAESDDWTEAGINGANAPAKGALLASFSGIVEAGQEVAFDLSEHLLFGPDSFLLTVQDGRGGFTSAVLAIQVVSPADEAFSRTPTVSREGENTVRIRFEGIPGFDHLIQRSIDLQAWITLATVNGGASGEIDHIDPAPPAPTAFYRIATP